MIFDLRDGGLADVFPDVPLPDIKGGKAALVSGTSFKPAA
jgi:hypothetical protein